MIWVLQNGQQTGPFSKEEVKDRLMAGEFDLQTLAWKEGLPDWQPLAQVVGISLPPPVTDSSLLSPQPPSLTYTGQSPTNGTLPRLTNLLFSFSGRASRLQFWLVVPLSWFAVFILRLHLDTNFEKMPYSLLLLTTFGPLIPILWISLATQVKRWHDRNKSGWWVLINMIPCAGPIWTLVELGFFPASPVPNEHGRPA